MWEIDLAEQVSQFWGQYADDIYSGGVVSVAWSPDGRYLATGNRHYDRFSLSGKRPSSVILFDSERNFQATYLTGHTAEATRLASTGGDVKRGHPKRRLEQPDEVAEVIDRLLSDEASFVNGHTLSVDGGVTAQ